MDKKAIFSILIGLALVGGTLFKSQFLLEKRIEKDKYGLVTYSFENLELLLPIDTVESIDTSYLPNGDVFCITKGIGSNTLPSKTSTQYGLSTAEYSKEATDLNSFHPDSLENNLYRTLINRKDFQLIALKKIKFKEKEALSYEGHKGELFERAVVFNQKNIVYSINMVGPNLDSKVYQEILESVKIKIVR